MAKFNLLNHQGVVNYTRQGRVQNFKGAATRGELALGNLLRQKLHLFKGDVRTLKFLMGL